MLIPLMQIMLDVSMPPVRLVSSYYSPTKSVLMAFIVIAALLQDPLWAVREGKGVLRVVPVT